MKSIEFWRTLPLSEKLHMARLVVESSEGLSRSASEASVREAKLELEGLATKMLLDVVSELGDKGRY